MTEHVWRFVDFPVRIPSSAECRVYTGDVAMRSPRRNDEGLAPITRPSEYAHT
ncbi:hypothetical protein [Spongiactinospora sp. TRM90649]|uniref:hypothetical protein n=1 Tax=Spongiactinospora sp. TRM90649 TaxID=3031114 RepID=UPI0023F7F614|nr:hypothetical protein [Spongiactinospora sp. TRM90649]MDF5757551.1 hypothetical protein [Spongiactinospora sp. TRM90649]